MNQQINTGYARSANMKTIEQEISEANARWCVEHDAEKCQACNGTGVDIYGDNDDMGVINDPCGDCKGKGYIITEVIK